MKNNMKIALQRAQTSTVPKPPKRGSDLPKAQIQLGNTTNTQTINNPLRQRSWLGRLGTRIGNIFRPDHRDLNPYVTQVDPTTRKNVKTYMFNDNWGNTSNNPSDNQSIITPDNLYGSSSSDVSNVSSGPVTTSPFSPIWPGDRKTGGDVGSSNYMKALKQAKKGGSTR
jgi:hypothetical protein